MTARTPASLASGRDYLQRLNRQLHGESRRAFLFSAGQSAGNVVFFTLVGWWIGESITRGEILWPWLLVCLLALAGKALLQYQARCSAQNLGEAAENAARQTLFSHWLQPHDARARHPTEQANLALEPVTALYGYFARFRPQLVGAFTTPLLILLVVGSLNWVAALLLAVSAPLIPLFMVLVGMGAARLNLTHLETTQKLAGLFVDRVRALGNIRLFDAQTEALDDIKHAGDDVRQANMATLRLAFVSSAVLEFFSAVAIAAVAIYIGFSLLGYYEWEQAASLTLTQGLIILLLAPEFFQPLRTLASHYHDRAAALGAAQLLQQQSESVQQASEPPEAQTDSEALQFRALSFSYPVKSYRSKTSPQALIDNLNLTIEPGQTLLLNGPSGQGKSTLLHLLSGQLSGYQGQIIRPQQTQHIAYLGQDPFTVVGTLADNLRLVAPEADEQALLHAVQAAGLDLSLDTPVYEHGAGISGGEKRRLGLARMHLRPAALMLFDEPTASLDEQTAQAVIAGIKRLQTSQRVLVIASHDIRFAALADLTLSHLHKQTAGEGDA